MKKRMFILLALFFLAISAHAQVIPLLEIRINKTATAKDDYVNTTYVPCNIRLNNGASFTNDISVTLRNIPFATGGQVLFSVDSLGPGSPEISLVTNRDNSSTPFYIKNSPGFNSVRDKDAIIEIIDNRPSHNAVVLGRKGLMIVQDKPIPESLPEIEMQINSVSTLDDYVTWSPAACRIRLANYHSFSSPVDVTLRNMAGATASVNFANNTLAYNTAPTGTTLNLSLPNTGTWVDFFIAGRYGSPSLRDKDAIIEVIKAGTQTVVVQDTIIVPGGGSTTVFVRDTVVSLRDTLITSAVSRHEHVLSDSVTKIHIKGTVVRVRDTTITVHKKIIPGEGGSGPVVIDTSIVLADGLILTREPLMVRVRKNANSIAVEERQRFLNALTILNNTFNGYKVLDEAHIEASSPEAHGGPGFLTWHRAFILGFERRLQTVDPSVTLPYWRFDLAAPNLFSRDFMGSKPTVSSDAFADFNASDPLIAWNMTGGPGIRRTTAFANNQAPPAMKSSWISETATLALGTNYTAFAAMEQNPHGHAHNVTGMVVGDWIKGVGTSVRDPLFFLIHGNVDRLWARWQWINNRFDAQSTQSYYPQGAFAGTGTIHIGHYLNDTMWPWNGVTGTYTGTGTVLIGNRPTTAPGGPLPEALSIAAPVNIPRPLNMIDYRTNRLITEVNSGMGFCYDDVPFQ